MTDVKLKLNSGWLKEMKLCQEIRAGISEISELKKLPKYQNKRVSLWSLVTDYRMTQLYSIKAASRGRLHASKKRRYSEEEGKHISQVLTMADQSRMIEDLIKEFAVSQTEKEEAPCNPG